MNKPFKKIYIEITNHCNLSCDFCIQNKRPTKHITIEEFKILLPKLEKYTNYLYFHILGEPLIHPNINQLINLASQKFHINITTNGYLINRIKENQNIRQLNISLHSFDPKYNISLDDYLNNIFHTIDQLIQNKTYISLRLWVKNKYSTEIIQFINTYYHTNIDLNNKNYKIKEYLFISRSQTFIWPDLNNHYYNQTGKCYALKDHIGILVDGTVVPCCLDTTGTINLGNIYQSSLEEIINQKRCINMLEGFSQNQKREELCKQCSFFNNKSKDSDKR